MVDTVLAMSGGLDSVVLLHHLLDQGKTVRCIGIDFGNTNSKRELQSARYFAGKLAVSLEVMGAHGLGDLVTTHGFIGALDGGDTVDPDPPGEADMLSKPPHGDPLPTGYHITVGLTAFYARLMNVSDVSLGLTADDIAYRPGITEYIHDFAKLIPTLETTSVDAQTRPPFKIAAEFESFTKADVIMRGLQLGVPLEDTYSCYNGRTLHCGICAACRGRRKAFADAGVVDPTWYEELPNVAHLKSWGLDGIG